jgi:hypothetical protein
VISSPRRRDGRMWLETNELAQPRSPSVYLWNKISTERSPTLHATFSDRRGMIPGDAVLERSTVERGCHFRSRRTGFCFGTPLSRFGPNPNSPFDANCSAFESRRIILRLPNLRLETESNQVETCAFPSARVIIHCRNYYPQCGDAFHYRPLHQTVAYSLHT